MPGGQEPARTASKQPAATKSQGARSVPEEGGPYHDFRVLSNIFVPRRIQDHPAGIGVQAVNVENSVFDVPSRPLKDLWDGKPGQRGESYYLKEAEEEDIYAGLAGFNRSLERAREILHFIIAPLKPKRNRAIVPLESCRTNNCFTDGFQHVRCQLPAETGSLRGMKGTFASE